MRYDEELSPITKSTALGLGSAVHKGLETRNIDAALAEFDSIYPTSQEEANELQAARCTVQAALEGYFELFEPFDDHEPEKAFKLPVFRFGKGSRTHFIAGKMDDIVHTPEGDWIVEYKTASQLTGAYFERLYVDEQITMYCYAAKRLGYNPIGVIYRVIRKPTIKPRKGEAMESFLDRLSAEYKARPEFYYYDLKLYRSQNDLEEFEHELQEKIRLIESLKKKNLHFRFTASCSNYGSCPYLPLCCGERGAAVMFEHKEAHEELKGEGIWD